MKKYILIAGVNGAGKSTLYQTLNSLKEINRVNTDEIVRRIGDWNNTSDVIRAGKIAVKQIKDNFEAGNTFNQETTLCGNSIMKNIHLAKELGYYIELHYIGVASTDVAKERVKYRVEHGGHGIPDEYIEKRYVESFKNLKQILPLCDLAVIYDNTYGFNRFAIYQSGKLINISNDIPAWYKDNIL